LSSRRAYYAIPISWSALPHGPALLSTARMRHDCGDNWTFRLQSRLSVRTHVLFQVALANSSQEIAFTKLLIENGLNLGSGPAIEEDQAVYAAELAVQLEEAAAANAAAAAEVAAGAEVEAEAEEYTQPVAKSASGFMMIEEDNPACEPESEPEPAAEVQPEPAAEAPERAEEGVPPG
jgi:hypothetical protein